MCWKTRNNRVIFTVRKSGTSNFLHCGSQWAKHLVESSFSGAGALLDSSSSCRLVIAGRSDLCSGRKKRLTCSSVLKAFTKTTASENVTRKLHVFIVVLSACLKNKHNNKKISMKYCSSASFPRLRIQCCLSDLLYRYEINYARFCINFAYSTAFVVSWLPLIRDKTLSWQPQLRTYSYRSTIAKKAPKNKIRFEGNIISFLSVSPVNNQFSNCLISSWNLC